MSELKYKVGDKVRIKSIDWYNENKDEYGVVLLENGKYMFFESDTIWCGKVITIVDVCFDEYYTIVEDFGKHRWTDDMIEGLAEESFVEEYSTTNIETVNYMRMDKITSVIFQDQNYQDKVELELGDYELKQEGDKWFAVKKKYKYPTTYEECCNVLDIKYGMTIDLPLNYTPIIYRFTQLLICRDAYWKIAGEEMGLGKPWEPDWSDLTPKYTIVFIENDAKKVHAITASYILAFPIYEMRDTFYENFKDLINECKELL